jgi:hypothetical protein
MGIERKIAIEIAKGELTEYGIELLIELKGILPCYVVIVC